MNIPKRRGLELNLSKRRNIFLFLCSLCLTPIVSPPIALLLGIIFAQIFQHPFPGKSRRATSFLLELSVVGLGFSMDLNSVLQTGKEGFLFTITSISAAFILGTVFAKVLKVEKITSFLISGGTAICGGSAVAVLSPVIKAESRQISAALGVVFILNSLALFVFPFIGHQLNLSQNDFALWSAIAIHDTSSVIGAAAKYGEGSLQIATTVKLARSLWIIPVAFLSAIIFKTKGTNIKIPYFIGLFILAVIINTYVPAVAGISPYIVGISKAGLTLTLFLIGTGLSIKLLKTVGFRPILLGAILWILISILTLITIVYK